MSMFRCALAAAAMSCALLASHMLLDRLDIKHAQALELTGRAMLPGGDARPLACLSTSHAAGRAGMTCPAQLQI